MIHFSGLQQLLLNQLDHTGIDLTDLTREALFTDLGADPTDMLDVILAVEDHYKLTIPEDIIDTFTTPGAIHRYLEDILDPQP
jgi:acyl carrier protein